MRRPRAFGCNAAAKPWGHGVNDNGARASKPAITSKLGRIPTKAEYMADMGALTGTSSTVYKYLNFDQVKDYTDVAATVS